MATLATPIRSPEQHTNPACVKVVFDNSGRALYFSRSPIPFVREPDDSKPFNQPPLFFQHLGIYAYRREVLLEIVALCHPRRSSRRRSWSSFVCCNRAARSWWPSSTTPLAGIDTPADYAAFVARQRGVDVSGFESPPRRLHASPAFCYNGVVITRADASIPLPLLITGVAGVAGYNAFEYFRARYPGQVVAIRQEDNWPLSGEGIIPCNAEDHGRLRALFDQYQFQSVLNCAGNCALRACELDSRLAWRTNVEGLINLLSIIVERNVRLVHFSIDLVFSGEKVPGTVSSVHVQ